jgi:hypothetical protein
MATADLVGQDRDILTFLVPTDAAAAVDDQLQPSAAIGAH